MCYVVLDRCCDLPHIHYIILFPWLMARGNGAYIKSYHFCTLHIHSNPTLRTVFGPIPGMRLIGTLALIVMSYLTNCRRAIHVLHNTYVGDAGLTCARVRNMPVRESRLPSSD